MRWTLEMVGGLMPSQSHKVRESQRARATGQPSLEVFLVRERARATKRVLGDQRAVNVRNDAAATNEHVGREPIELLIATDGELDVSRNHALEAVVARGVARQLEHLGDEILS